MTRIAAVLFTLLVALTSVGAEREVEVFNPAAHISLAGTLVIPDSNPKAVIVLASGSGQQNRDEELAGGKKPFLTIAGALAKAGYATLRLDDRGTGASQGVFEKAVNDDFVSDIRCALAFVDSVFCGNIPAGVLGHSEGGTTTVKTAVSDSLCRFIVTLACPAWRGDSVVMQQCRMAAHAATGKWDKEKLERRMLDIAMSSMPDLMAKTLIMNELNHDVGPDAAVIPHVHSQLLSAAATLLSPWCRDMLRYDPAADIAAVRVPWLAINGNKDMQVPVASLATIKALNPMAVTLELPGHNHLFQPCTNGMPSEYAQIKGDISQQTTDAIVQWLDSILAK